MPPTPPEDVPELSPVMEQLHLRDVNLLRRTGKTLLATAELADESVVVKLLLDDSEFWGAKWRHEIGVYRAFADYPPPIRVPRLVHTDGQRLLILERLDARPLDTERYPQRRLACPEVETIMITLQRLAAWRPPGGNITSIFDYADRVNRYYASGYFDPASRDALHHLLDTCGNQWQLNHGDPLPSNLLRTTAGDCALIDWEFTGFYLPGFDLAMLYTMLGAETPKVKHHIDATVAETGTVAPFAVNLALVVSRELRIHHELPDTSMRRSRLNTINVAWEKARQRLHDIAAGLRS